MIKAYYEEPNKGQFECRIEDKIVINDNTYYMFDVSPFYPGGGGEEQDKAAANGCDLVDCIENEDKVYYSFNGPIGDVGDYVSCVVDTALRNKRRIMHTSQHILSALFWDILGMTTESVHFSDTYAVIDLSGDALKEGDIEFIEKRANEIVRNCIELETFIAQKSELHTLGLRKIANEEIDLPRIVRIPGVDVSLCCAMHVQNTGNIGLIKVLKTEHKSSLTKVSFTSGEYAIEDYTRKNEALGKINVLLSSTVENVFERVRKREEDINHLKKQMSKMREALAAYEVQELMNSPLTVITKEGEFDELKILGSMLTEKAAKAFIGIDKNESKIIICQNIEHPVNTVINILKGKYDVKGGGNAQSGQILCREDMQAVVHELTNYFDPASLYVDSGIE